MTPDDFKKLLDEALTPIKETQKEHTEVLNKHTRVLDKHTRVFDEHTRVLNEHTEALETLQSSTVTIENTIVAYGDMYKINNSNSKKLEKRIEALEDKSGVTPPPEYTLADVS